MFSVKFDQAKLQRIIAKYRALSHTIPGAIALQVYPAMETAMREIKQDDVPRKTGNLASTGLVNKPQIIGGETVRITAQFGGQSATYAVIVHENPRPFHPHGRYKYLWGPMQERYSIWRDAVRQGVLIALSGGIRK